MTHRIRHQVGALLALGATLLAPIAHAGDPAAAQQLFTDAKKLIVENKWAEACPKLEESQRLDPGIGTQFNLANCYERVGKTASAWAVFLEVAGTAKTTGQTAREKAARDRAALLEPKLSRLTITVRTVERGIKITRDDAEVGRGQWGAPLPVDPGDHRIVASAPAKKPFERSLRVPPDAKTIVVEVPTLADEPIAPAPVVVVAPPTPPIAATPPTQTTVATTTEPPAETESKSSWSAQKTLGLVAGGVGLVGLGVGTGFGFVSKAKHDDASSNGHCIGDRCDDEGVALRHQAMTNGTVSTVAFIAGGALLAGGTVFFLTAPKSERSSTSGRLQAAPIVGAGTTGVILRGGF
jgi:hypothetical protein